MYGSIQALAARVTRVSPLGVPQTLATDYAVINCNKYVSCQIEADTKGDEGSEWRQVLPNGRHYPHPMDRPVQRHTATIEFLEVEPAVLEIISGVTVRSSYSATPTGFGVPERLPARDFALELWTRDPVVQTRWVYWLVPGLANGTAFGIDTSNDDVTFTVEASANANPNWGVGPYNVLSNGGTPAPLATPADAVMVSEVTTIAPPT